MPKASHSRGRSRQRRQQPTVRPLALAQHRAWVADQLTGPLAARVEEYVDLYGRLAQRRVLDRRILTGELLCLVAGWGALAAGSAEGRAGDLLAAALYGGDAFGFPRWVLEEAHLQNALRNAAQRARLRALELAGGAAEAPNPPAPSPEELVIRLEALAAGLRDGRPPTDAVVDAVVQLQRERGRLVLSEREPGEPLDEDLVIRIAGASVALGDRGPERAENFWTQVAVGYGELAGDAAHDHRVTQDIEDPGDFFSRFRADSGELEAEVDALDSGDHDFSTDDVEEDASRDREALRLLLVVTDLDNRLAVTDDPHEGAEVASLFGTLLLDAAAEALDGAPVLWVEDRIAAALWAAAGLVAAAHPGPDGSAQDQLGRMLAHDTSAREHIRLSVALLRAAGELPQAPPVADDELRLRQLDRLLIEVRSHLLVALEEEAINDGFAGLGAAGAATEAFRLAVHLARQDPDRQAVSALALSLLDLQAVAAFPDLATRTAARLEELGAASARSDGGDRLG